MTKLIADASLPEKLRHLAEIAEVYDTDGRMLGYFDPTGAAPRTPNSIEELQKLRQQRTGRPLTEILADLEQRARP